MTYELEVMVAGGKATARLDTPSARDVLRGEEKLDDDPLRRDTVRVLRDWLSRWQVVSKIGIEKSVRDLPVAGTFRVLGEQLYRIIFKGDVGRTFDESYKAAKKNDQSLRVMLSFAEDSTELASLPWEFLHCTNDAGRSFYLATETNLVLNRSLPTARQKMQTVNLPLRVLFVMCTPVGPDQQAQRDEMLKVIRRIKRRNRTQLSVEVLENWDFDRVQDKLHHNPHIVHMIGHAHSIDESGHIAGRIGLPSPDGTLQWSEPQLVVDFLTHGKSQEELPRLVILHLSQMGSIDFRASFERLAPELIKAGVMAVLAMQYPVSPPVAALFTDSFYQQLIQGDEIDEIVQQIRWNMRNKFDELLIGTPVLYMQSLSARLVAKKIEFPGEGKIDPHLVSTEYPANDRSDICKRLIKAVWSSATDETSAKEIVNWIEGGIWSEDSAVNEQRIRQHMLVEDPYLGEHGPMYLAMIKELKEQR